MNRKKVVVGFFFVSGKFRKLWSFVEPKEEHYSRPSSRIKGCKTWKFSKEKWKKVLEWSGFVWRSCTCSGFVWRSLKSVGSVESEEILRILQRESGETC